MEFTKVQIEKAKNCKTIEELKELAKNEGLNLTEEDIKTYFNTTRVGELNDDDLDKVAGGKEHWVYVESYQYYIKCPFCSAQLEVIVDKHKCNNGYCRYDCKPSQCGCGATIRYHDNTMNFTFTKDGEDR